MTKPIKDKNGCITNAVSLTADQVAKQKVFCPAGCGHPFKEWPFGWDSHSGSPDKCGGTRGNTKKERRGYFKGKYLHLFHDKSMERYR